MTHQSAPVIELFLHTFCPLDPILHYLTLSLMLVKEHSGRHNVTKWIEKVPVSSFPWMEKKWNDNESK
jgi:hypothetical protein